MIEDILEEATPKLNQKVKTEDKTKFEISSDKELLEEFINNMDLESSNITNIESVAPEIRLDKYLWVIRQKEIELGKCKALAEESINRTQSWLEKKEHTINSTIEFLTNQMRNYLSQNSLKKLSLPNGNIGYVNSRIQ
jgi:cell division FtsZ-interacting protein ZapD